MFNRIFEGFQNQHRKFVCDDNGIGTVELILITVVLIGLVVIFRDQLTTIVTNIFGRIAADSAAL